MIPFSIRLRRSGLFGRLQSGVFWNLVAGISTQGTTFVINIVIANMLGRAVYGKYASIVGTLLPLSLLAQLATGYTITRYLAELSVSDKQRAGRVVGLCSMVATVSAVVASVALAAFAPFLAGTVFKSPDLTLPAIIGALFLAFSINTGYQMGVFAGLGSYRQLGILCLVTVPVIVAVCAGCTWMWGLNGAIFGLSLGAMFRWIVIRYFMSRELAKHDIHPDYRNFRQERAVFVKFALPAALTGFTMAPAPWLGNVALARQPHGFSQIAVYSASMMIMTMVLFIPRIADRVAMTMINQQKGAGDERGSRRLYLLNVGLTFGISVGGGALAALFGPAVLRLFGKAFMADGYGVLLILLGAGILEATTMAICQLLQSNERMWTMTLGVNLPRDASFASLAFVFAHQGAVGLAKAYLASQGIAFVLCFVFLLRVGFRFVRSESDEYECSPGMTLAPAQLTYGDTGPDRHTG